MKSNISTLALVGPALAASCTSAPSGCITVAKSGGQYSSIESAINSLSTTSSAAQCVFIGAGTYNEQVLVPSRTAQLTVYGYSNDTSGYAGNGATITASKSQANGLNNDESATLRVKATNFKMYNINVNNGYGQGSQAVALSAYADSGYYGCAFTGFQDTLLSNQGTQLFSKSMIQGATDFIFGQKSFAWFEYCDIRVLAKSLGYVTANGASSTGASKYVFNRCDIAAASGNSVPSGAYYLGRPWGEYADVTFQNTTMSSVINSEGWHVWNTADERTSNVVFGEYANTGSGASGTRASFSKKLSSAVSITSILGSSYTTKAWYDASYM